MFALFLVGLVAGGGSLCTDSSQREKGSKQLGVSRGWCTAAASLADCKCGVGCVLLHCVLLDCVFMLLGYLLYQGFLVCIGPSSPVHGVVCRDGCDLVSDCSLSCGVTECLSRFIRWGVQLWVLTLLRTE